MPSSADCAVCPLPRQVSRLVGFVDREGGSWFQEWSALFVMEGEQGDRVIYHYPRLQGMQGAAESAEMLAGTLERGAACGGISRVAGQRRERRRDGGLLPQLSAWRDALGLARRNNTKKGRGGWGWVGRLEDG